MKFITIGLLAVALSLGGLSGCKGTTAEIRADGYAIADTGSSIVKKAIDAGLAVYAIIKSVVTDVKDNVYTVKELVTGETPAPASAPPVTP